MSFFQYVPFLIPSCGPSKYGSQTAKDVRAEQDTLFELFERMEAFFRRLDTYTEAAPNASEGMVDTISAIMVEVLNILAITTKEIKQGQMSKSLL